MRTSTLLFYCILGGLMGLGGIFAKDAYDAGRRCGLRVVETMTIHAESNLRQQFSENARKFRTYRAVPVLATFAESGLQSAFEGVPYIMWPSDLRAEMYPDD